MAQINLSINGKNFGMECDDGQEQRVLALGEYVDNKIKSVSAAGAANNENHLLILTSLMLADEIFELRDSLSALGEHVETKEHFDQHEQFIVQAIDTLADRIDTIANRIQKA